MRTTTSCRLATAVLLLSILMAGCGLISTPPPPHADYLVIVVLDACRPDYLTAAPMPNLQALMAAGTYYDSAWVGQVINETPTSHASLSTGLFPAHTGYISFEWIDPATGEIVSPNTPEQVSAGGPGRALTEAGAKNLIDYVKRARPQTKAAAVSNQKDFAAAAMGGAAADYVVFGRRVPRDQGDEGDGIIIAPSAVEGQAPPSDILLDPELRVVRDPSVPGNLNHWAMSLALKLFERERPQVLLINLPEADTIGHAFGNAPEVMAPIMAAADLDFGRLVEAYKAAGIYDQTVFVFIGDHGMIPYQPGMDIPSLKSVLPAPRLGVLPYAWLPDPAQAPAVAEALARLGVAGTIGAYARVGDAASGYRFEPAPTTLRSLDSTLNAAYLYLLSTLASGRGPDLALMTEEDRALALYEGAKKGHHISATWGTQHIPVLIVGPGVKAGQVSHAPARLVDIAPTVLTLLGVSYDRMDGIVLADAFTASTAGQRADQNSVNRRLAPLRDALRDRSLADQARQARQK